MKKITFHIVMLFLVLSCQKDSSKESNSSLVNDENNNFIIAFGSCNNQFVENLFWEDILKHNPDIWIWGGDIIYSDTHDPEFIRENYTIQKENPEYANFNSNMEIMGTWDDHDYGKNDGGVEYPEKAESQQLFLDFLGVPANSERRNQKGIFFAKDFKINDKTIKIIILDTRYFRTSLTEDKDSDRPYKPNPYREGTILGETQWTWLKTELENSTADFHVFISSIQFLSGQHGWETWANMPHEVDNFINLLVTTKTKNAVILSGDRHISDFSKKDIDNLPYPLIDFTSSGLTHSSTNNLGEPNKYRIGDLVNQTSYGLLKFDFNTNSIQMEMRGKNNSLLQSHTQTYN